MDFRDRLFELRRQAGLSQEELANLLGLTRQAVQKWEAGTSRPDMDNLIALANYFHVSLDYLVTGQEAAAPPSPPPPHEPAAPPQPVSTVVHHYYHDSWHYEYKSRRTLFGLPLLHINVGHRDHWARGIIAIGNIATGFVALGGVAVGLLSLGGVSFGLLLALGAVALGGASIGGGGMRRGRVCRRRRCGRQQGRRGRHGFCSPGHRASGGRRKNHPRSSGGPQRSGADGGPQGHHRSLSGRTFFRDPDSQIFCMG